MNTLALGRRMIGMIGSARCALVLALAISAPGVWAQDRFIISADGSEAKDNQTGLVWRRCSAGQTYNAGACTGTVSTYTHEQALMYAKSQDGWRLPNVKELASIGVTSRVRPSIDLAVFPGTPSAMYWSSSSSYGSSLAGSVSFEYFGVYGFNRNDSFHVRLVR